MTTSTGVRVSDVEQALGKIREDGRCREAAVLVAGLDGAIPAGAQPNASHAGPVQSAVASSRASNVTVRKSSTTTGPMSLWHSHHPPQHQSLLMKANHSSSGVSADSERALEILNDQQQRLDFSLNQSGVSLAPSNSTNSTSPDPRVINASSIALLEASALSPPTGE